ncbi:phosphatase PAP2 family protein [Geomonas paludis]|uniref:PAP2 family phosphoesterase n=1 Tax=Geomonas paludis TaxID=2740185 RepID=A0A6V8MUQ7_9BACT|nr:phosphatase PAP2 family protein [Geomonas paludis]UPU38026.1 phosphatase PAP2 family protein [Geomonas paludis]GFO63447.1 PAP2 family phosphoesterase [Geomonas paludis]
MSSSRSFLVMLVLWFSLFRVSTASADSALIGHTVMAAIPVSAIAIAFFKHDTEGEKQWLRNLAANQALTSVARLGFNETDWGRRPNGHPYGFPSGHVAFAGSGAAFLSERYGWKYGVPAWIATAYVGYNRVDNNSHRWRDVIASGLLSYGVGKLFVTPENATHIAPVIGPDWLGMRWQRSW